jgi:microcystin-dependent protein
MGTPYIGEIRMFAGNFAPVNWAFCNGALQAISQNQTLFQLIGTTYGGDGVNTFALPDLRGRVPVHQGQGPGLSSYIIGEMIGVETVTLTAQQIPAHNHPPLCRAAGSDTPNPANAYWGASSSNQFAATSAINGAMNANAVGIAGGSQPHDNVLPYLTINFIIALFGVFPSQT